MTRKKVGSIIALVCLIIIIGVSIFLTIVGKAQGELVADLTRRLDEDGVPLKQISIKSQFPFSIEVVIQRSSSVEGWSDPDSKDLWYYHLTSREIELSTRYGYKLDSYILIVLDSKGERASWVQIFLVPERQSQKPYPFVSTTLDDKLITTLANEQIKLFGLTPISINVTTGIGSSLDVQLLRIRLSAPDMETANKAVLPLVGSMKPLVDQLNQESDARITVIWLTMVDRDENRLLEYLWDLELGTERGGTAEGVTRWFTPPPAKEYNAPTGTPSDTVLPTQTRWPYP